MSKSLPVVAVSAASSIADAVKAQVKTYGATVAMIKAVYSAEGMASGPTLAEVVAILLDPTQTEASETERTTFYETYRKTAQRAIGDDCLIPPVFLLNKETSECRVIMLAKDADVAAVKAAGMPTREENKALMAIMVRDKVPADKAPKADAEPTPTEEQGETTGEPAPTDKASDFDQLVALLATMDADAVRRLVGAIGQTNPAQLVTIGDAVNTALKAASKQAQELALVGSYKSAAPAEQAPQVADMSASQPASVIPQTDVVAALATGAKPQRAGNKRANKRAA